MKKQRITTNLFSTLCSLCLAVFFFIGHVTPSHAAITLDFEDLVLGDQYYLGDTITTNGVDISVGDFQWGNGVWCSASSSCNYAMVDNGVMSGGGSRQDMEVNNVSLVFKFGSINGLSLRFGEYGGNLNITINGVFQNFNAFSDIDGTTIGGVSISVVSSGSLGTLTLSGVINSFAIGGQELWIDDVTTVDGSTVMDTELFINRYKNGTGDKLTLVNKFDIFVPVTVTIVIEMVIPDGTIVSLNSWPGIPFGINSFTVPVFNYTLTGAEQLGDYLARITIRDFFTNVVYASDDIELIFQ